MALGLRWAGYDPDHFRFRIPLPAKDNFRLLMDAILSGEIICETLTLAKRPHDSKSDSGFYIETYIDDVHNCIQGNYYDRKLLRWATLSRKDFYEWCGQRGITPPSFWFPDGWKFEFQMPEGGTPALLATHVEPSSEGNVHIRYAHPTNAVGAKLTEDMVSPRINQRIKIACQQIAHEIWADDINRTIPSIVNDELIQKYGGAGPYQSATAHKWIQEVAPLEVSRRVGRPKKQG